MRYQASLTFPLPLDRACGRPLHEQIAGGVRSAIERGLLPVGSRLPSTRTLSEILGVSRGVTSAAYDELSVTGEIVVLPGSGTYIARRSPEGRVSRRTHLPTCSDGPIDLRPEVTSGDLLPLPVWRAAWREATFRRPPSEVLPGLGLPALRRAVATHLAGARCLPPGHTVVITAGAAHGLRAVLDALGLAGRRVALEDPAPLALRRAAGGHLDPPCPLPVDADGARTDAVPAGCGAVVLTADAHVPFGHRLSAARREHAAEWARRTGGTLIEMASDPAPPAGVRRPARLDELAPDHWTLVGELLVPTLRLGYAVVPSELAVRVGALVADRGEQPPYATQVAATTLLRNGDVRRATHQLTRLAAERSGLVGSALSRLRSVRYEGATGSGAAVLHLPPRTDAQRVADALLARGVRVTTLAPYHAAGRRVPSALVIGYLRPSASELREALAVLRTTLDAPLPITRPAELRRNPYGVSRGLVLAAGESA